MPFLQVCGGEEVKIAGVGVVEEICRPARLKARGAVCLVDLEGRYVEGICGNLIWQCTKLYGFHYARYRCRDVVNEAGGEDAALLRAAPEGEEADGANDDKLVQGRQAEEPL